MYYPTLRDVKSVIEKLNKRHNLYDFLALRLNAENPPRQISQAEVEDFMWVEAKSGNSKPSEAQIQGKSQAKIRVMICRGGRSFEQA